MAKQEFVVVDVQGFNINIHEHTDGKMFIPKELAAYDGKVVAHYIFKPPFPYSSLSRDEKKQVNWLERNYHSISWSKGYVYSRNIRSIMNEISKKYNSVYVKGFEKCNALRQYLIVNNIIEISAEGNVSLNNYKSEPNCMNHKLSPTHCALSNVYLLYEYFVNNNGW